MDMRTLGAFLSLASNLNFSKSAEQVYISQPAFSRQITSLEDEFGCELFFRNKRKVELTEYGHVFMDYAERILSEYNKWMIEVRQMQNNKTGHLRIGFLRDFPHSFLPDIIKFFHQNYGNIQLSLSDCGISDIINGLLREEVDFGFGFSTDAENVDIDKLVVSSAPICVAAPENRPFALESSIQIEKLANEQFIMMPPDVYSPVVRYIHNICKLGGFEPNIAAYSNSVFSILMLVKCGIGITLLSNDAKVMAPEGVRFIPLDHELAKLDMTLLWKTTNKNPAAPIFLEAARILLKDDP